MPLAGGTFTGDVTFSGDNYNVVWDKSDNALEFADLAKATFGSDADLQIYHSGSTNFIDSYGSYNLNISVAGAQEPAAIFRANSSVDLYHNGIKTFQTEANGILVNGPEG